MQFKFTADNGLELLQRNPQIYTLTLGENHD